MNHGTLVRTLVNVAQLRLDSNPDSSREWESIYCQLNSAARHAKEIVKLAERMERSGETNKKRDSNL
jgi:hypothetical protein